MKTSLIVFGEDWGRHPSSTQHLVKHLVKERQVIWVNSIGLRRPRLSWHDLKRVIEKVKCWCGLAPKQPAKEAPENLTVVNPMVFPAARSRLLRALNRFLLTRQLRRVCEQKNIGKRDLWISLPSAVDYVGHLQEQKVIYYCGDDFSALAGVDHYHISECELELVEKAHHILVASQSLWTKFAGISHWKEKLFLLEHGVDLELFTSTTTPAELIQGERPVAGFYGTIADWLDMGLILRAAKALPHWRFVFIGRIETDVSLIAELPNVELLPPVPHHELPCYAQHWQVSILPFRDCGQIQACNPLKLKEYLACGKPVVSTQFPAVNQYRQVVDVVRNQHELIDAIKRCEHSHLNSGYQKRKQMDLVKDQSWQVKALQVSELLV